MYIEIYICIYLSIYLSIAGERRIVSRMVLQCIAVYCSVLQCVAVCCSALQYGASSSVDTTASHFDTLQHTATHCNALRRTATHCIALQHTATLYDKLRCTTTHCNTLQHTSTHTCDTLKHTTINYTVAPCNILQHSDHPATHRKPSGGKGSFCWRVELGRVDEGAVRDDMAPFFVGSSVSLFADIPGPFTEIGAGLGDVFLAPGLFFFCDKSQL